MTHRLIIVRPDLTIHVRIVTIPEGVSLARALRAYRRTTGCAHLRLIPLE